MKSIRPRLLFVGGTTASVLFNFAIAATLLRREAELAEFYWHASFLLAGAVSLLASLPIFGGMTFISWRVHKKTTLREATRCKRNFRLHCHYAARSNIRPSVSNPALEILRVAIALFDRNWTDWLCT